MSGDQNEASDDELLEVLRRLREQPLGGDAQDKDILPFYRRIVSSNGSAPERHWFCEKARLVVRESATFLIRLFAHQENEPIRIFKDAMRKVLGTCELCACRFQEAKVVTKTSYLSSFDPSLLTRFFETVDAAEADMIMRSIQERPAEPMSPAVLMHTMMNPNVTMNSQLAPFLISQLPTSPKFPFLPPGVILLLFHSAAHIRVWARDLMIELKPIMGKPYVFSSYKLVLKKIFEQLSALHDDLHQSKQGASPDFFTDTVLEYWNSIPRLLNVISPDLITNESGIVSVVLGHLHDGGPHFPNILRSLLILLKQKSNMLWETPANTGILAIDVPYSSYSSIVFDAIKDNTAFLQLLEKQTDGHTQLTNVWALSWLTPFAESVAKLSQNERTRTAFADVQAKMAAFTLEELQHTRFKNVSPFAVQAMMKTIGSFFGHNAAEHGSANSLALREVIERHDGFIAAVAFSHTYQSSDNQWKVARQTTRDVLFQVLNDDISHITECIPQMVVAVAENEPLSESALADFRWVAQLRTHLWTRINSSLMPSDHDALRNLISLMARLAAYSALDLSAYRSNDSAKEEALALSIKALNAYLYESRKSFISFATKASELSSGPSLRRFLQEPCVVADIFSLIISPDEELQQSALAIVTQAYDVDVRAEGLRCLFENFPDQALGGLASCIKVFSTLVSGLREASKFAQALVLVLNDVCDVLCSESNGLLLDGKVRSKMIGDGKEATIANLWKLMTEAISELFTLIPHWSHFLPGKKLELMTLIRDVIILGRELIEYRKVFQGAVEQGQSGTNSMNFFSPRNLSKKSARMVDNLQPMLSGSLRMLRLTDMELLHQSCKLIEALFDVFRECRIPPNQEAVEKLQQILDQTRVAQATKRNADLQSRLNESQLSSLTLKLKELESEAEAEPGSAEDEVTFLGFIEPPKAPKRAAPPPSYLAPTPTPAPAFKADKDTHPGSSKTGSVKIDAVARSLPKTVVAQAPRKILPSLPAKQTSATSSISHSSLVPAVIRHPKPQEPVSQKSITPASSRAASSSSESESESEGEKGISALDKHQKSPVKVKERRGIKLLNGLVKQNDVTRPKYTLQEEAQRQAMRLRPDVSGLYKMILQWDYEHTGTNPPDIEKLKPHLQPVPKTFKSPEHYFQTFEPLLRLECWSQLMKSKDEPLEQVRCRVNGKGFVDQYLETQITICQPPNSNWFLSDTDIVIFRRESGGRSFLAKVQEMKRMRSFTAVLRFYNSPLLQREPLSLEQDYILSRVFSLSTMNREYAALKALSFYDLVGDILSGRLTKPVSPSHVEIRRVMEAQKVNEPQARSILSSLSNRGFSLIQGPPGTGKTLTICGIIGSFISTRVVQGNKVEAGKVTGSADRLPKKKILLCAPSNAAIDEVAKRIRDGVRVSGGKRIVPSVVRIGTESSVNISTKDISLDFIVDQKLEASRSTKDGPASNNATQIASLRLSLEGVKKEKQVKVDELASIQNNSARTAELEKSISNLNAERQRLIQRLNKMQDDQKANSRTLDATRRRLRLETLIEADVICSTLSGAGHEILEQFEFDTVIIDEAAQSIELSSLIPLKYSCIRCILVGDPKQLPPTVLSPLATQYHYNYSLFSRLESLRSDAVHLLSIQYRMHPDISKLPSQLFYNGRLLDGPNMAEKTRQPWHESQMFKPYRFFDVSDGNEEAAQSGYSLINKGECHVAIALYRRLKTEFRNVEFDYRIGLVSMYRAQIQHLKREFQKSFGADIVGKIDFSTVDGFQGQEKDIIILSCVRGGPSVTSVGFLRDERRMNVSITRARSSLFILGHAATLERSDDFWKKIVQDASSRGCLIKTTPQYFEQRVAPPSSIPDKPACPQKKTAGRISSMDAAMRKDLLTPRALVSTPKAKTPAQIQNANKAEGVPLAAQSSQTVVPQGVGPENSRVIDQSSPSGVSKPHTENGGLTYNTAHRSMASENAPRQQPSTSSAPVAERPPLKRKKKEPNLFIPKKRPLPSDMSSNPNSKRRQL